MGEETLKSTSYSSRDHLGPDVCVMTGVLTPLPGPQCETLLPPHPNQHRQKRNPQPVLLMASCPPLYQQHLCLALPRLSWWPQDPDWLRPSALTVGYVHQVTGPFPSFTSQGTGPALSILKSQLPDLTRCISSTIW